MGEYHIVAADGSGTIASFSEWSWIIKKGERKTKHTVFEVWQKLRKKRSVNLLCIKSCGCIDQSLMRDRSKRRGRQFQLNTWKLRTPCEIHAEKREAKQVNKEVL